MNQAVRRNLDRFPDDFTFQLSVEETAALRSQIVTLKDGRGRHAKYAPLAFTEQGVAMLSSVLRSPGAVKMNILIMRELWRPTKASRIDPSNRVLCDLVFLRIGNTVFGLE